MNDTNSIVASTAELVGEAANEFFAAISRGEEPSIAEFSKRYPEIAEHIRRTFPALLLVGNCSTDGDHGDHRHADEGFKRLGDFRILHEIGRGGMGTVFEAEQLSMGRRVALKVLPFAALVNETALQRFRNEVRAAASLNHPNIVPVYFIGEERGVHFYAMQLIRGQTLANVIAEQRKQVQARLRPAPSAVEGPATVDMLVAQPPSTVRVDQAQFITEANTGRPLENYRNAARLGIQAAEALQHAHDQGVLHRDIKPGNLMLDSEGKLFVTDFGLARIEADVGMTMTGDIVGTLRYMAPEQALTKRVVIDHRADIYSLGATLYELLTLQPAFGETDRSDLLKQIAFEEPRPLRKIDRHIPAELETIVLKAMEKNPDERYQAVQRLADDLRAFIDNRPIQAKPPTLVDRATKWSRRHRAFVWAVGTTSIVCGLILTASIGWLVRDHAARKLVAESTVEAALGEASGLVDQAKWHDALAIVRRAQDVLSVAPVSEELNERAGDLRRDIEMDLTLERVGFDYGRRKSFSNMRLLYKSTGTWGNRQTEKSVYADEEPIARGFLAFRDYGIDLETLAPKDASQQIRERRIWLQLVLAIDSLARWCRGGNDSRWKQLIVVARAVDPDPWRNRMRDALGLPDKDRKNALAALAKSARSENLDPNTAVSLAAMLEKLDDFSDATLPLRASLRSHINEHGLNAALAQACINNPDQMLRFSSAAVAIEPRDWSSWIQLGKAFEDKGKPDEALDAYRTGLKFDPTNVWLLNALGNIYSDKAAYDAAIANYRKAIKFEPKIALSYVNLTGALKQKGNLNDAIVSAREAVKLEPNSADYYRNLGIVLNEKGQLDEADANYREAIRLNPNDGAAYELLGIIRDKQGRLDEAIECLKVSARLGPEKAEPRFDLGICFSEKGRWEDAVASLRDAIRVEPNYEKAYYSLGVVFQEQGKLRDSISNYEQAIRLTPNDYKPYHNLALILATQGRTKEAERVNRDSLAPLLEYGSYFQCLFAASKLGPEAVSKVIEAAVAHPGEKTPEPIDALVMGELRLVAGNAQPAEAAMRAAIRGGDPENYYFKSLGLCLLAQGKGDEAKQSFLEALKALRRENGAYDLKQADPDHMTAAYFLDLVTEQAYTDHFASDKQLACFPWFYVAQRREIEGKKDAAIKAYERCVELGNPDNPHTVRALAEWKLRKLKEAQKAGQK